jgi:ABC-type amino acid transport substrate-binding protein
LQSIVDAKVLRVAVTQFNLPAFHARGPDGKLIGPEIEMAQQIGTALGVGVEFIEDAKSFDGVVDLVATGRSDIGVSKLSQTYARLRRVRFSEPYVTLRHALLFNRSVIAREADGRPPAAVLQNYHGKIGVIAGSAYVDFGHKNFPKATSQGLFLNTRLSRYDVVTWTGWYMKRRAFIAGLGGAVALPLGAHAQQPV